jgi:hypothetical protein
MPDVSARYRRPATSSPSRTGERVALNLRLLVVSEDFATGLRAADVAGAIGRGLRQGGLPAPDLLALPGRRRPPDRLRALLEQERVQARMLASRALVVATASLRPRTLPASAAFELATRARQGGVPAYAIAGEDALDSFQARILDLQLILEASSPRSLAAAGRKLAGEVLAGTR